jgi:hypothetical protein
MSIQKIPFPEWLDGIATYSLSIVPAPQMTFVGQHITTLGFSVDALFPGPHQRDTIAH